MPGNVLGTSIHLDGKIRDKLNMRAEVKEIVKDERVYNTNSLT